MKAGEVHIVVAGPSDAADVFTMVRELASHEASLDALAVTERRWREMLTDDEVTVLLAIIDGQPVGYVSAVRKLHLWSGEDIVALDDLYVRAAARNAGVGEALMRALAERCGDRLLRWEVDEGNLSGQRFYLRLGARLRRKVVGSWRPSAADEPPARPTS